MQRSFLLNLALLLVLNLLVKPFYILGIDAGVQDAVGTAAYGGYAALLSLSFLLNILLDAGITNFNARHVAQHTHLMRKHLSGVLAARGVLAVLYAGVVFCVALLLGYRDAELTLLGWLVLNQVLVATVLYLRSNIAGAQKYRWDGLLSVLDRVLLIGMIGWLLWGRVSGAVFRIEWFVWAQTIAYGATALVALALVLRLTGRTVPVWRPVFMWAVLRQSFPYALLILLMTFYYRTDSVMLERMLPDGALQAGIYAQGFRFFEAFNMLGFLFAGLLLPMFSRMLRQGDDVAPLTGLAFRLILSGSIAVAVVCSLEARTVMDLRYSAHTAESSGAFSVLVWCFVGVCTTYIFGTLLTAGGELRMLNWMAAGGMVLNIGLNIVLIPKWHALGAAWASLITQGLTALVQLGMATKRYRLGSGLKEAFRIIGFAALVLGAVLALQQVGLPPLPRLGAMFAAAGVLAMATGMASPKTSVACVSRSVI